MYSLRNDELLNRTVETLKMLEHFVENCFMQYSYLMDSFRRVCNSALQIISLKCNFHARQNCKMHLFDDDDDQIFEFHRQWN